MHCVTIAMTTMIIIVVVVVMTASIFVIGVVFVTVEIIGVGLTWIDHAVAVGIFERIGQTIQIIVDSILAILRLRDLQSHLKVSVDLVTDIRRSKAYQDVPRRGHQAIRQVNIGLQEVLGDLTFKLTGCVQRNVDASFHHRRIREEVYVV